MKESEAIFKLEVKGIKLLIIYNKLSEGLYSFFSSDKRMYDYIQKDIEGAFINGVQKVEDKVYLLNIASTEDFGAFEWKNAKDIIDRQLTVFMPIVQKFIVSALTEALQLQEQD